MNKAAKDVLAEMTRARRAYLEQVGNPATSPEVVVRAANDYVALLVGLLDLPSNNETETAIPASARARRAILFKWRDALSGEIIEFEDIRGELICCLLNVGLWHCLYASRQLESATEDNEEAMKNVYRALLAASGYFSYVESDQISKFNYEQTHNKKKVYDLDPKMLKCMAEQLLAEAQEVTVNRAREKGHADELVAALALNERDRFVESKKHIETMDPKLVEDIWSYFDFKIDYYEAYALCFNGDFLFKQEKAGDAIKCYREAALKYEKCQQTALAYSKKRTKRKNLAKSTAQPVSESYAFVALGKKIKASRDKAEHENGFIYKMKVPSELPELVPSKSLITAKPYELPERSMMWNEASFDAEKVPVRGDDHSADTASSDNSKVVSGPHHASGVADDNFCSIM